MVYKKVEQKDIQYLMSILDESRVLHSDQITEEYGKDELGTVTRMPEVVVKAENTEEVSKIMRYAYKETIPVVVRGSGTGLVGGCVPTEGGIVLDLTLMNKILELDEENLTLTVEAGVLLMDIYDYVQPKGYFYAPDPGEKTATIGGNISTNAGGMRAVKYGVTRNWIRALEVVLPNGEVVQMGGKVVKDCSGYALKQLMIGSEGTLGIVTKAVLKLIALPKHAISLLVPFENIEKSIHAVTEIIKTEVVPTAIEFFDRDTIQFSETFLGKSFPDSRYPSYLLLSFDGNTKEQLEHDYQFIADLCLEKLEALDVYIVDTDERKESVWSARDAFLEAIKASTTVMDECDVVVPRHKIVEFVNYTHEVSRKLQLRIPSFGHAGDGNLHVYICKDDLADDLWEEMLEQAFDLLYAKAKELGGLVSGEHGIGFAKRKYLLNHLEPAQIEVMRGIKKVFDPKNILNPGKVI